MSAVKKISRENIISAALEIIKRDGMSALNVRALAKALGCSTRPVYLTFGGMDGVKAAAVERINEVYQDYINREVESGAYPPYKAYGMGYIKFARGESEFFKYLFMRDRTRERTEDDGLDEIISMIVKATGLDRERAKLFHLENWIFVHGIAVMLATAYIDFDEKLIGSMLTDMFEGLKARFGRE